MDALSRGYLVRYTTLDDLVRGLRNADALGKLSNQLAQPSARTCSRSTKPATCRSTVPTPTASSRWSTVATPAAPRSSPATDRRRVGRDLRRRSPRCRDPRPPPPRRRGARDQRPQLQAQGPPRAATPSRQTRPAGGMKVRTPAAPAHRAANRLSTRPIRLDQAETRPDGSSALDRALASHSLDASHRHTPPPASHTTCI